MKVNFWILSAVSVILIYGVIVYSNNTILGQYGPGYEPTPQQLVDQCTIYNNKILKIVTMGDPCSSAGDAISYWLSQGYKIAGVGNGYLFLTK
jgi:hypothetical protein